MSIEQFNREFKQSLQENEAKTVGGLVLRQFGELPSIGTTVAVRSVEFSVRGVKENRIQELSVIIGSKPELPAVAEHGETDLRKNEGLRPDERDKGQD